jgi:hypothetical protein
MIRRTRERAYRPPGLGFPPPGMVAAEGAAGGPYTHRSMFAASGVPSKSSSSAKNFQKNEMVAWRPRPSGLQGEDDRDQLT